MLSHQGIKVNENKMLQLCALGRKTNWRADLLYGDPTDSLRPPIEGRPAAFGTEEMLPPDAAARRLEGEVPLQVNDESGGSWTPGQSGDDGRHYSDDRQRH